MNWMKSRHPVNPVHPVEFWPLSPSPCLRVSVVNPPPSPASGTHTPSETQSFAGDASAQKYVTVSQHSACGRHQSQASGQSGARSRDGLSGASPCRSKSAAAVVNRFSTSPTKHGAKPSPAPNAVRRSKSPQAMMRRPRRQLRPLRNRRRSPSRKRSPPRMMGIFSAEWTITDWKIKKNRSVHFVLRLWKKTTKSAPVAESISKRGRWTRRRKRNARPPGSRRPTSTRTCCESRGSSCGNSRAWPSARAGFCRSLPYSTWPATSWWAIATECHPRSSGSR